LEVGHDFLSIVEMTCDNQNSSSFLSSTNSTSKNAPSRSSSSKSKENSGPNSILIERRITIEESKKWKKMIYGTQGMKSFITGTAIPEESDHRQLVLSRARFILSNSHLVPKYHLLKYNCECLAIWCKLGIWTTVQVISHLIKAGSTFAITGSLAQRIGGIIIIFTGVSSVANPALWLLIIYYVGMAGWNESKSTLNECVKAWNEIEKELNDNFWKYFWSPLDEPLIQLVCSFLYPDEQFSVEQKEVVQELPSPEPL